MLDKEKIRNLVKDSFGSRGIGSDSNVAYLQAVDEIAERIFLGEAGEAGDVVRFEFGWEGHFLQGELPKSLLTEVMNIIIRNSV